MLTSCRCSSGPFPVEASATDRRTLSPDEHQAETRNTQVHVHEVDNRVDALEEQFIALMERQRGELHELGIAVIFCRRLHCPLWGAVQFALLDTSAM